VDYDFRFWNVAQFETRRGKLGVVENTGWEGRGDVCCHVRSYVVVASACVG
jgi:hypothetical protein